MPRSSKSFLFPDVNVWLALSYDNHVHHEIARNWFKSLGENSRLCFCRFTQLSFLRLLTTEAVMKEDVLSQSDAWVNYDRWMADGRIFLIEEPANFEDAFRSLSRSSRPTPKDWADSYLAAFSLTAGIRLVTFDRAFRQKLDDLVLL